MQGHRRSGPNEGITVRFSALIIICISALRFTLMTTSTSIDNRHLSEKRYHFYLLFQVSKTNDHAARLSLPPVFLGVWIGREGQGGLKVAKKRVLSGFLIVVFRFLA